MEEFKITQRRRDEIWAAIKVAVEDRKKLAIRDILFDDNYCEHTMAEDLKLIDSVLTAYDEFLEKWDRFLHCGKTEKEEIAERWEERQKQMKEDQEKIEKMFGKSPFSFK